MTLGGLARTAKRSLATLPGWRSDRRIVVIESDDWGSIRMPSRTAYEFLVGRGVPVETSPYNRLDALETAADLERLFDVLASFRDSAGHHPVITANYVTANPDFGKIREADFERYEYETLPITFARNEDGGRALEVARVGAEARVFEPQLHGREHLNVRRWLRALRAREPWTMAAFEVGVFGHPAPWTYAKYENFTPACDLDCPRELAGIAGGVTEAAEQFQELWGYRANSFVAPCYRWPRSIEVPLRASGVRYLQGTRIQLEPVFRGARRRLVRRFRWTGQRACGGQRYLVRNAYFEPAHAPHYDWVDDCLDQIQTAFRWGAPAIICSHRVNYVGGIEPDSAERSLRQLRTLLTRICATWSDVEFLSSARLGDQITRGKRDA